MEFKIMSETITELAKALSKAQGEMEYAKKDMPNPFFKSKYSDLASVLDCCKKPLADNGLSFSSATIHCEGFDFLVGTLLHSSGEWLRTYVKLTPVKADMQGFAASVTYARRCAINSLCNIASEDDDGNSISGNKVDKLSGTPIANTVSNNVWNKPVINGDQVKELQRLTSEIKNPSFVGKILAHYGINSLDKLAPENYELVEKRLNEELVRKEMGA